MITKFQDLDLNKTYSYADYLSWQFKERVELIKGQIFKMSPTPNTSHQEVSTNIFREISNYLKGKKCKVFSAPFDVRFPRELPIQDGKIEDVVQPDICVICDLKKLDKKGCLGAPDFIVEILSSTTSKRDVDNKFKLYEKNGVLEYWIVHPLDKTLLIYTLKQGKKYVPSRLFTPEDVISISIFDDLKIDLGEVFDLLEF